MLGCTSCWWRGGSGVEWSGVEWWWWWWKKDMVVVVECREDDCIYSLVRPTIRSGCCKARDGVVGDGVLLDIHFSVSLF
jgi:hypothetical protein